MKIVGIAGRAGSGKDTVADFLVARYGFTKVSMAGPLKSALATLGFPEPFDRGDKEKLIEGFNFTWREAAQKLGTEFGRALDPDIWVKIMAQRFRRASDRIVVSDIRFENEAAMIREAGGRMLHLTGRFAELGANAGHSSETPLEVLSSVDGMIDNSGDFEWTKQQVTSYLGLPR